MKIWKYKNDGIKEHTVIPIKKHRGGIKMNSFDDFKIDKNELNDIASLRERIDDMNNRIDHLDEENHSYRRRLCLIAIDWTIPNFQPANRS